jgi:succinylglutamic semialdehyde dehydrogenase
MKFQLKGDYVNGAFLYPRPTPLHTISEMMIRPCPADLDEILWECPVEHSHVDSVLQSVTDGYKVWRKTTFEERTRCLRRFKEKLLCRVNEFAEAIAWETGKPLWESQMEALSLSEAVDVTLSDASERIAPKEINDLAEKTTGHIQYRSIGPCLIIGPFNFPCAIPNAQILSALLAGNSVIFKPSEKAVYSAQLIMECFDGCGFPPGVVNSINGHAETVKRLLQEKSTFGIFFTGSRETGKKILEYTHTDLWKFTALSLGGKNTTIIHHDADMRHALPELLRGCFQTAGQNCLSTSKVAIHRSIKSEFIDKFHEIAKQIVVDHPVLFEHEPFMGPLIEDHSVKTYLNYVGMAKREGYEEIMRGKAITKKYKGHYASPSIHYINSMKEDSHILKHELLAPMCVFIGYDEIEEAVAISNDTRYGLAAAVFSSDEKNYRLCLRDIDAGLINFNCATTRTSPRLPLGGFKDSGNYHPSGIGLINACVHSLAGLAAHPVSTEKLDPIHGLTRDIEAMTQRQ